MTELGHPWQRWRNLVTHGNEGWQKSVISTSQGDHISSLILSLFCEEMMHALHIKSLATYSHLFGLDPDPRGSTPLPPPNFSLPYPAPFFSPSYFFFLVTPAQNSDFFASHPRPSDEKWAGVLFVFFPAFPSISFFLQVISFFFFSINFFQRLSPFRFRLFRFHKYISDYLLYKHALSFTHVSLPFQVVLRRIIYFQVNTFGVSYFDRSHSHNALQSRWRRKCW